MTRNQRRDLNRRAERALSKVRGQVIAIDAAHDVIIAREDSARVIAGDAARFVLGSMGLTDILEALEERRRELANGWVPVVVIVAGQATGTMIETFRMVRGGVA